MALQHLEQTSYAPGGLDGYTSYSSSDSSAPRTPSPRDDGSGSYPAVFTPEMHASAPSWAAQEMYAGHEDGHHHHSKGAPPPPPPSHSAADHPGAGPRRNTFPSVHYDRPYGLPYEQQQQQQPHHPADAHPHYGAPPATSGSPHPPYHEYDHHYARHAPPPPPHGYYAHPAHMGMPPPPPHHHPAMHHPHLGMTYISPHTGLPVQHTDDAASKETQYLRRRCFNCHTTEPPSWRRSTLNPGKIVCNKCGLYERTHLRPRPLRFDELRAGNKARKAQPSANGGTSKKGGKQSPPAQAPAAPAPAVPPPAEESNKAEPRDYSLVRRSSVSSSGSSANTNSDWDSGYSQPSNTSYSSPASTSYPLPQRSSHSPQPNSVSPQMQGQAIRLPSASLSSSSPLMSHASPHLGPPPSHLGVNGSPQMYHAGLLNAPPRSPPRKSHSYPYMTGNGRELVGESPPA